MLDLQTFGRDHGIPVIDSGHHHCHEGWLQTHCPFCSPGAGFHLGFSLEGGNFHCWRCGSHRTLDVLARWLGDSMAARRAWGKYQTDSRWTLPTQKPRRRTAWTPPGMEPLGKPHSRYLRGRRFDPDRLAAEWDLVGTGALSGPRWGWRVVFPIRDRTGRTVAYGGRSISDTTRPKYRLPDDRHIATNPRSLLYGIHRTEGDAVVIVEGPADVWRLGPGAVALLGSEMRLEQAIQLKGFRRRYIMLDPDSTGTFRSEEIGHWLGIYSGDTELISELSCDPGDLPQEEADQIMRELIHGR